MYRLIYKSRSSAAIDRDTIMDILHVASDKNKARDLTGALIATRAHFLQVLEGDFDRLNEIFTSIARDPRHTEIQLVAFGPAEKRLFEGWNMRGIGTFDLNTELEAQLRRKYGEEEGGVNLPVEEWSALSIMHDVRMMQEG